MAAKRNVFAAFGWFVWKLLALVGLPLARRKIADRDRQRTGGNAVTRRLRSSRHRSRR